METMQTTDAYSKCGRMKEQCSLRRVCEFEWFGYIAITCLNSCTGNNRTVCQTKQYEVAGTYALWKN